MVTLIALAVAVGVGVVWALALEAEQLDLSKLSDEDLLMLAEREVIDGMLGGLFSKEYLRRQEWLD